MLVKMLADLAAASPQHAKASPADLLAQVYNTTSQTEAATQKQELPCLVEAMWDQFQGQLGRSDCVQWDVPGFASLLDVASACGLTQIRVQKMQARFQVGC